MSIDEPRDPKSEVPQEATESGSQQPLSEGMPGPAKQAPNRKWWLAIPAVVVIAVIGVAAVGAAVPAESEDKEIRATQSADLDLGEVTVRELSDSLAEHGLALEIYPEFDEGSLGIESDPGTEADGDTQDNDDFEDSEDFGEEGDNLEEQEPAASFKVSGDELDATGVEPKQAAVATAI